MREDDFRNAMKQIELPAEAQQRIIAACATGDATVTPRRQHLPFAITIAATVVLLLAVGALLPRLLNPGHSFTITAYALDENGETMNRTEISAKAVSFDVECTPSSSSTNGGDYGELLTRVRFICEGENIASITYSAEGCRFLKSVLIKDYQQWQGRIEQSWIEKDTHIYGASWTALTPESGEGAGEIYYNLGESYTVTYAEQQSQDYALLYPLHAMEADYNGDYPVIMNMEAWSRPPTGVMHSVEEDMQSRVTRRYIAKEVYISVTVSFTDGTEQQKTLLLTPKKHSGELASHRYTISIEVIE